MAGIAVLMPAQELYEQAGKIVEHSNYHITAVACTTIEDVIPKTREAIDRGANIIISRGRQAYEIKRCTNIPVVEMVITAQELGLIIVKAKKLVNKPEPRIGVIAWNGMLCDITYFRELYDAEILVYPQDEDSSIQESVLQAIHDGVDVIIGGQTSLIYAKRYDFPALELTSTGESVEVAIKTAEKMYQMLEEEQHNYATFSTILDSSFNGILKIDKNGVILTANRVIQQIAGRHEENMIGLRLCDLFEGLEPSAVKEVLSGKNESHYTFLNICSEPVAIVIEAITVNEQVMGAIVSCNRLQKLELKPERERKEQYLHGYAASSTLEDMERENPSMSQVIKLARAFAQSNSPLLIEQASGTEAEGFCEGIHNYSLRRGGPFVLLNLAGIEPEDQIRLLFGGLDVDGATKTQGALLKAKFGTLVLMGADKLTMQSQYYLSCIMQKKIIKNYVFGNDEIKSQFVDVRLIFCASKDLSEFVLKDRMRKDFYYKIQALSIKIPTLNEREKDKELLLDAYMEKYMRLYSHFHVLTPGAKNLILNYRWECGTVQMEAFVDRLILTVGKRTIKEEHVRALLEILYSKSDEDEIKKILKHELTGKTVESEEALIRETLKRYGNQKVLTAKALGISKSTLWRKIRKYNL